MNPLVAYAAFDSDEPLVIIENERGHMIRLTPDEAESFAREIQDAARRSQDVAAR